MKSLRVLGQVTEKLAPGRSPSFNEAHVLKALELLGEGDIGRKQLASKLSLGEGMTRNLISRLQSLGLLVTSRRGMSLSEEGVSLLNSFKEKMISCQFPESQITVDENNYAVLIRGGAKGIKLGLEQRDNALMAGARGATTLLRDEFEVVIPGTQEKIESSVKDFIENEMQPKYGDVIIIGSSPELHKAEIGAKAAALKLLGEILG